ncbi:CDP-glycerol glycerophosphotransferase family protein [Rubritalea tangerina]|uniref:CDP-glycerol glycerophosphotransferase family protein n=2 Tax=Rubritalea tangerina TaxID=430798 RepID=A0ABW4ZAF1_9BACT
MKEMLKKLVTLLIRITPKRSYCYMKAMPSYDDSAVAVYNSLPLERLEKVVWSYYNDEDRPPFEDRGKTIHVKKGSVRDFYYGIVSKYIFTTHGHFIPDVPKSQICVNMWHGMPFKAIGLLNHMPGRRDTYICATSPLYQKVMSDAFGVSCNRVLTVGSPRNDYLFAEGASIWNWMEIDRSQYAKVFIWLPTYRQSVVGDIRTDGLEVGNVYGMGTVDEGDFERFLERENCLCLVKAHPMSPKYEQTSSSHVLHIDEKWLWERGLLLYQVLGQMDFLISDISSVMVDFSLLDRPMIACFEDATEYMASRPMVFENIFDWLPASVVHHYSGLKQELQSLIRDEDPTAEKRGKLMRQFHQHIDGKATERLLKKVL